MTSQRLPRMFERWPGDCMNELLDDAGRDVVGVVVPADVLAGDRVAVVLLVEDVEDVVAARRDVVAEVVAGDHVLAPPAGDRRERRVDLERAEPGRRPRLVREADELPLRGGAERARAPRVGGSRRGQQPDRRDGERDGEEPGDPARAARHGTRRRRQGQGGGESHPTRLDLVRATGWGSPVLSRTLGGSPVEVRGAMVPGPRGRGTKFRPAAHRTAPHG